MIQIISHLFFKCPILCLKLSISSQPASDTDDHVFLHRIPSEETEKSPYVVTSLICDVVHKFQVDQDEWYDFTGFVVRIGDAHLLESIIRRHRGD